MNGEIGFKIKDCKSYVYKDFIKLNKEKRYDIK